MITDGLPRRIGAWARSTEDHPLPADFEELFLTHYQEVYRHLARIVGDPQEAQDLAQETFLRLYQQSFVAGRSHNLRAWLYRVATNLAYNALRSRQRRLRREGNAASAGQIGDPVEVTLHRAEQAAVRQALASLPQRQAQLLLLRHAGLSYAEVAQVVGVAPGSVGTLLARAHKAFEAAYRAKTNDNTRR